MFNFLKKKSKEEAQEPVTSTTEDMNEYTEDVESVESAEDEVDDGVEYTATEAIDFEADRIDDPALGSFNISNEDEEDDALTYVWEEIKVATTRKLKDGTEKQVFKTSYRCPNCWKKSAAKTNFCPNCGVKLKKVEFE